MPVKNLNPGRGNERTHSCSPDIGSGSLGNPISLHLVHFDARGSSRSFLESWLQLFYGALENTGGQPADRRGTWLTFGIAE
jgi:hypothetical protein